MRIRSVDCLLLTGPYGDPPGARRSYGVVRVHTDEGLIGLGEPYAAVNMPLVVRQIVDSLAPHLVGRPLSQHGELLEQLHAACEYIDHRGLVHCVLGSIDWAIHDALAQQAGVPLCRYLNPQASNSVALYASTAPATWTPRQVIDALEAAWTQSFRFAKIRVGCGQEQVDQAIQRAAGVLAHRDRRMQLAVDAGQQVFLPSCQRWTVDEAMRLHEALSSMEAAFLEDPLLIDDEEGYRSLCQRGGTPIAGGEMFAEVTPFAHYLARHALQIAQPDASVLAGPRACLQVNAWALAHGRSVVMHSWAGPVAQMQNIHAALAMEACDLVEFCTLEHPLMRDALEPCWRLSNGRLEAPTVPGLGVSLDPSFQQRYPFSDTTCLIA